MNVQRHLLLLVTLAAAVSAPAELTRISCSDSLIQYQFP
jgi:hypothetical protein